MVRFDGIDRAALWATMKLMGTRKGDRKRLYGEIREMEIVALANLGKA